MADAESPQPAEPSTDPAPDSLHVVTRAETLQQAVALVGALVDEPIADQATELGIGFAWLLAASYVGFRIEGDAQLRLVGAGAFLFAAVAHFLSLLVDVPALAVLRLVAVLVGAIVLIVLVRR